MHFKNKLYIIAFSFFFVLTSCEDFFETTLELDPPPFEKTLVIDHLAYTGRDTIDFRISTNAGVLENIEIYDLNINDAEVILTVNGQPSVAKVNPQAATYYNYSVILPSLLKQGDELSILASHPSYGKASSTFRFLPETEILSAVFYEDGGLDQSGDERSKVSVKLKDNPGKNYYAVQIIAPYFNDQMQPTFVSSLDPSVFKSHEQYTVLLTDDGFDGKEKILDFQIYRIPKDDANGNIKLVWYGISEDYYKFSRSLNAHQNTADNPFGTPVPVTTNINGGTGIFAGHTRQEIDVD
jgi:Domain of unknown function (DUF4249)